MSKQTRLEATGIERRKAEIMRNDFDLDNEYSSESDAALSHDDEQHPWGKGTGNGGHTYSIPNAKASTTMIDYHNIDTFDGGGSYDRYGRNGFGGRNRLQMINLYGPQAQYGKDSVEIDESIVGQYTVK